MVFLLLFEVSGRSGILITLYSNKGIVKYKFNVTLRIIQTTKKPFVFIMVHYFYSDIIEIFWNSSKKSTNIFVYSHTYMYICMYIYKHISRQILCKMIKIQLVAEEKSKQFHCPHTFGKWQDVVVWIDDKLYFYLIMITLRNLIVEWVFK